MNKPISARDLELLSSYLDNQLSTSKKGDVERRLSSDMAYQEAFERLKRTRLILRSALQRPVPHNFTLTAQVEMQAIRIPSFSQILRLSSAVAALGLVVLLAFDFLPFLKPAVLSSPAAESEAAAISAPTAEQAEAPMIIIWGPPIEQAYGMGGGRGNGEAGATTTYVIPQPSADQPPRPSEEAVPEILQVAPQPDPMVEPQIEAAPAVPQEKSLDEALTATGPILGVRPANERGRIETLASQQFQPPESAGENALRISQIILGVVALLTGFLAYILRRK